MVIGFQDNGSGIPEEIPPHLFQPLFTKKPVGRGTSLGLATSYGILERSGGILAETKLRRAARF